MPFNKYRIFLLLLPAFVFLLACTQCSQKEPQVPPAVIDKTSNKLPAGKGFSQGSRHREFLPR